MSNLYIKTIEINKIYHLNDFSISMSDDSPHLLLTGKNGSGKTVLLNAIADFLNMVRNDKSLSFLKYNKLLDYWKQSYSQAKDEGTKSHAKLMIDNYTRDVNLAFGKLNLVIPEIYNISDQYQQGLFIFAFYSAHRQVFMSEPKNPTKPQINRSADMKVSSTGQFLNFMSDLKIQEALARNEEQEEEANRIKEWFDSFVSLLKKLFDDRSLELLFDYRDYSFRISTQGKSFKFTELSDGFAAAIDIIADLIMKMQDDKSISHVYNKKGIVLIDEIETHLHLSLQKDIMQILTSVFPNIQFIVTTHSPFVLSSLDNSTAFDLEHREAIDDLSEYSYESLAEGYFGVKTESSYVGNKLAELKYLISKEVLEADELARAKAIIEDFYKIPEIISPFYVGEFRDLMIRKGDRLK